MHADELTPSTTKEHAAAPLRHDLDVSSMCTLRATTRRGARLHACLCEQLAELRRLQAGRASKQAEVSAIDAETQQLAAQTAQLNKAQAALQAEVRCKGGRA